MALLVGFELACPTCGSEALAPEADAEVVALACRPCRARWHYVLGWLRPVGGGDPVIDLRERSIVRLEREEV